MDLRKYIRKAVNTENVLKHEYAYYSHASGAGSLPCLLITIAEIDDKQFPSCYEIMMHLDQSGRIFDACRQKKTNGIGYLIKRFPDGVEQNAETTLADIICGLQDKKSDLSILRDRCDEWETIKKSHV